MTLSLICPIILIVGHMCPNCNPFPQLLQLKRVKKTDESLKKSPNTHYTVKEKTIKPLKRAVIPTEYRRRGCAYLHGKAVREDRQKR